MSEHVLRLIPTNPATLPPTAAAERAQALLQAFLPLARRVTVRTTETVEFVDAGSNWGPIACPACHATLDDDWWAEQMGAAAESAFADLAITTPCCGTSSSLNDLAYAWPVGFARFVLEAADPGQDLPDEQVTALEQALGYQLRRIHAHY